MSKRLKRLNVPQDTYFYWYPTEHAGWLLTPGLGYRSTPQDIDWRDISAYTLSELHSLIEEHNYSDIRSAFLSAGGSETIDITHTILKVLDPDFLGQILINLLT